MTSVVLAVLVITLLLPGLALLFAVVLRYLFRSPPRPVQRPRFDEDEDTVADGNGHADTLR